MEAFSKVSIEWSRCQPANRRKVSFPCSCVKALHIEKTYVETSQALAVGIKGVVVELNELLYLLQMLLERAMRYLSPFPLSVLIGRSQDRR